RELVILEEWETKKDLENHMASAHFKSLIPQMGAYMDKETEINTYQILTKKCEDKVENEVLNIIAKRKSTRNFKEEQLKEAELQAILTAGIQAPSANNDQPWHFTTIQDKKLINHISDKSKELMIGSGIEPLMKIAETRINLFYHAPTIIVVSGKDDVRSALVDCSAAIENMLIAAESINIGAVWVGLAKFFFTSQEESKKIHRPEGYTPLFAVAVGYKKAESTSGPSKRNQDVKTYMR
ncbi:MAG: nitroreductase family protein, partial [Bacteroidaceae bacterium]